jgi:hypothetical protein
MAGTLSALSLCGFGRGGLYAEARAAFVAIGFDRLYMLRRACANKDFSRSFPVMLGRAD